MGAREAIQTPVSKPSVPGTPFWHPEVSKDTLQGHVPRPPSRGVMVGMMGTVGAGYVAAWLEWGAGSWAGRAALGALDGDPEGCGAGGCRASGPLVDRAISCA